MWLLCQRTQCNTCSASLLECWYKQVWFTTTIQHSRSHTKISSELTRCSLFSEKLASLQQYLVWMCDAQLNATSTFSPPHCISSALTLCLHACTLNFQQDIPLCKHPMTGISVCRRNPTNTLGMMPNRGTVVFPSLTTCATDKINSN